MSTPSSPSTHWSRLAERGSQWGLDFVALSLRLAGPRFTRWFLYPITAYFYIANRTARQASKAYLTKVYAALNRSAPTRMDSFLHMLAFAQSGVDRLQAWRGQYPASKVHFPDLAQFERIRASGKGALLIGSHLGNLDMTRAVADPRHTNVHAIVYSEHAVRFNELLSNNNPKFKARMIQVSSLGADAAISLQEKIDQGDVLVIVGDRTPANLESQRVCSAHFLGEPAPFAQGPFILAALLGCPVYTFFCVKRGKGYEVVLTKFDDRITLPRGARDVALQGYIARYAKVLEAQCQRDPLQWFNFFDFWNSRGASPHV